MTPVHRRNPVPILFFRDIMKNISKIIIAALLAVTFALSAQPVKAETTPSNQTICGAIGGDF